jgi:hypothetical protein
MLMALPVPAVSAICSWMAAALPSESGSSTISDADSAKVACEPDRSLLSGRIMAIAVPALPAPPERQKTAGRQT